MDSVDSAIADIYKALISSENPKGAITSLLG
jgi:hypothetical protein